jgi:hypothetical protein
VTIGLAQVFNVLLATATTQQPKEYEMTTKLTTRQRDKLIEAAQNAPVFTVVGSGQFPFDMLRYDHCWPTWGDQSGLLTHTEQRRITLSGLTGPTPARWASFGWKVVD